MEPVTFDWKILGARILIGTLVIALALVGTATGLLPAFASAQAFVTFAIGVYGTALAIDLASFTKAKKEANKGEE